MCPAAAAKYCLAEQELRSEGHASELCGANTNNLLALRKLLPDSVSTPASAVIPFGTLAKTLADAANAAANAAYAAAVAAAMDGGRERIGSTLRDVQASIGTLAAGEGMRNDVLTVLTAMRADNQPGAPGVQGEVEWAAAFDTIKRVWASTWNDIYI
jgi:hypothetical protein